MTERTVTTSGTGSTAAQPDIAEVRLWVAGRDDVAEIAHERARDTEASLRTALSAADVPEDCIRRTDAQLEDRDNGFEIHTDDPEYRAEFSMVVDCVPEQADDIVGAVLDAGDGSGIERISFDVGDEARMRLGEEALDDAMTVARRKAEAIAAAEGLTVGEVLEVTTDNMPSGMESIVDDALGSSESGFHPNPVEIEASVEATFELQDGD
ncbi:DUF541 domain-containing protein [Natronomonas sp. CBA1123]|jgi:uncharacterized protein YggE|uniref:SIMPL domain-containing protein n=1 Tax=Natronomonas sp. CBA1123 TaxID=2668070 RepID=UPI0012EA190F|nr:SIMPL domain-containing protein [Natronomonas sp. CBA1123]MUV88280.1 DUF541 domain-containing protein [Natronomonas sp. CBA1123]